MTQFEMEAVFGMIDDEYLIEAAKSFSEPSHASHETARPLRRKRLGVLLAAAALAAAFTATAFATGLFGLADRLSREEIDGDTAYSETEKPLRALSLLEPEGSAEYQAGQEWVKWRTEYMAAQPEGWIRDDWVPADAAQAAAADFYLCFDQAMVDKLMEISGKYALKLHTERTAPAGMEEFYLLAGTEPFALEENQPIGGYLYEDGSFRLDGQWKDRPYSLTKSMAGSLPAVLGLVANAGSYEEWSYTNRSGDALSLAISREEQHLMAFCDGDGASLLLTAQITDKAEAEALADSIDFGAALSGEPQVTKMLNTAPQAAEGPGVTLESFAESPEYQAASEIIDYLYANGSLMGSYGGVFPMEDPEAYPGLEAKAEELCAAYGLTAHSNRQELYSYEEIRSQVGDFIYEGARVPPMMILYEDGSFHLSGKFHYIRKGSLCTSLQFVCTVASMEEYAEESWPYQTKCGVTVRCAIGHSGASLVLYETPEAWVLAFAGNDIPAYQLEALADSYDFTKLR